MSDSTIALIIFGGTLAIVFFLADIAETNEYINANRDKEDGI